MYVARSASWPTGPDPDPLLCPPVTGGVHDTAQAVITTIVNRRSQIPAAPLGEYCSIFDPP